MPKLKIKFYAWLFYIASLISKKLATKMVSLTKKEDQDYYDLYYKDASK